MKKLNFIAIVFIGLFVFSVKVKAQVGIGTSTPDSSSILELKSENQGLLLPRVNDLNSIKKAKEGLLIYNQTEGCISIYKGSEWKCLETPDEVSALVAEDVHELVDPASFKLPKNNKVATIFENQTYTLAPDVGLIRANGGATIILPRLTEKEDGKIVHIIYEYNSKNYGKKGLPVTIKRELEKDRIGYGTYWLAEYEIFLLEGKHFTFVYDHNHIWKGVHGGWWLLDPLNDKNKSPRVVEVKDNILVTRQPEQNYFVLKPDKGATEINLNFPVPVLGEDNIMVEINNDCVVDDKPTIIDKVNITTKGNGGKKYTYNHVNYGGVMKFYYNNNRWKTLTQIAEDRLAAIPDSPASKIVTVFSGSNYTIKKGDRWIRTEGGVTVNLPILGEDCDGMEVKIIHEYSKGKVNDSKPVVIKSPHNIATGTYYIPVEGDKGFELELGKTKTVKYFQKHGAGTSQVGHWFVAEPIDNNPKPVNNI